MAIKKVGLALAAVAAMALAANCCGTGTGSYGTCGVSKPAPSCKGMSAPACGTCTSKSGCSGKSGCDSKS